MVTRMRGQRGAYNTGGIKQALVDQSILDASLVAFPVATVAVAYGSPRPTDTGTTAAKQEVVV